MTPIYFGDSKSPLFGVLHEPAVSRERQEAVLLCPPIGQEHVRSHWALRQIAARLAREGFYVLRFDWFGVGDSAGSLAETSTARLLEDCATAAQELRDTTGIKRISVVGLRLGATIAALAAHDLAPSSLVLWDAVPRGAEMISDWRKLQREILDDPIRFYYDWPVAIRERVGAWFPAVRHERTSRLDELVGFRIPEALQDDLATLSLDELAPPRKTKLAIVTSSDAKRAIAFADTLAARNVKHERRALPLVAAWDDRDRIEELLLPGETSTIIAELLKGAA